MSSRLKSLLLNFPGLGLLTILLIVFVRVWGGVDVVVDPNGIVEISGTVRTQPYVKSEKLVFRVDDYLIESAYQNLNLGDKVEVKGKLLEDSKVEAQSIEKVEKFWLSDVLEGFRRGLDERIYNYFPNPQASLLSGVTLGIDSLPKEFKDQLITTGTIHVVVVSGYNIALVGGFFLVLAPYIGRKKASLLAVVGIMCYSALVGFSAPTLRAGLLGVITILSVLLGKRSLALYTLFLTGSLMLILNPSYLTDVSFQLSFLATLGIVLFTNLFTNKLKALPNIFREALASTLSAQVLVVPVLFYYFGSVSLLSPLVNSLVLWLIPVTTILGFIFLFVGFISVSLAQMIGFVLLLPLTIFTYVVGEFAKLEFFLIQVPSENWFLVIGYYLLVASFFLNKKSKSTKAKHPAEVIDEV